jgi:hypothetical protein
LILQIDEPGCEGGISAHTKIIDSLHIHELRIMQIVKIKQKGAGFPTPFSKQ